jgi:myo-inositol-1(or 4)-monophosphatase
MAPPIAPEPLLRLAKAVVAEAADTARAMRISDIAPVATKTTVTDVVTEADRVVEAQMIAALRAARPGDAFLGEETGAHEATAGTVRWIMDPIDGTVNYLYRLPNYAVSLAAEVDGVATVAVVCNAATGDLWHAIRGQGAFREGRRLSGSKATDLRYALVATGFGYDSTRRAHQASVLADVLPSVRDIRRFGAAALDLCYAAEGMVDAYFEKGLNPWDHAAGGLIAAEAGLVVAGLAGALPSADMIIAAPPALFAPLEKLLIASNAAGGP